MTPRRRKHDTDQLWVGRSVLVNGQMGKICDVEVSRDLSTGSVTVILETSQAELSMNIYSFMDKLDDGSLELL